MVEKVGAKQANTNKCHKPKQSKTPKPKTPQTQNKTYELEQWRRSFISDYLTFSVEQVCSF